MNFFSRACCCISAGNDDPVVLHIEAKAVSMQEGLSTEIKKCMKMIPTMFWVKSLASEEISLDERKLEKFNNEAITLHYISHSIIEILAASSKDGKIQPLPAKKWSFYFCKRRQIIPCDESGIFLFF